MEEHTDKGSHKGMGKHLLMMVVCCAIPLLLIGAAVYFFGLSKSYLYWSILLLCPLMHLFMMKDMHKHPKKGKVTKDKSSKQ